ncbi:hypothetical protein PK28_08215 [Hymenobacter sp. DG25B]|uniref:hypothetical protein n=1 Tax=Hymenobacter sp. DG25B TaxID=1385664 RepID=UPI000540B823|nr:hypothetical protein [Hymenobacter sp. DG25B]AIZ63679.1 hypothetical protein PK28_08215 [Hymenobacter sp. DG25B]
MKTIYRLLLLFSLLLAAHATLRAQSKPDNPSRTITGLGDPEPAMPRVLANAIAGVKLETLLEGGLSDSSENLSTREQMQATERKDMPLSAPAGSQPGIPR